MEVAAKRFLHQQVNSFLVSLPCCTWKCSLDISLSITCFNRLSSQWGPQEVTVHLSVFDLFLNPRIMAILSKGCKPDNFKSHNPQKLNLTNILGLVWIFLNVNLLTFLLYVRQTWMTQLILAILWRVIFL